MFQQRPRFQARPNPNKSVKCSFCGIPFVNTAKLHRHISQVHASQAPPSIRPIGGPIPAEVVQVRPAMYTQPQPVQIVPRGIDPGTSPMKNDRPPPHPVVETKPTGLVDPSRSNMPGTSGNDSIVTSSVDNQQVSAINITPDVSEEGRVEKQLENLFGDLDTQLGQLINTSAPDSSGARPPDPNRPVQTMEIVPDSVRSITNHPPVPDPTNPTGGSIANLQQCVDNVPGDNSTSNLMPL